MSTPSFGTFALIAGNLVLVITLCFYKLDPSVGENFQNIAYRCGFLSLGQIPLLFLLAGKNNIIGAFTGHSYERLNQIHRYAARTLFVTVTLHMGYWFANWAPDDSIGYQIKNDRSFTQTGLTAWAILTWIVLSSFAPIRRFSYEFFYIQHVLSFVALIAMVFVHTPAEDHGWLWAGIAVFIADRVIRAVYTLYRNLAVFHSKQGEGRSAQSLWACHAALTPLADSMTRVTVHGPRMAWKAGQHAVISCHSIAPLQGHPFTISSLTSDNKLEFMIKAQNGSTRRLYDYARKNYGHLPISKDASSLPTVPMIVNGIYGNMRALRQFDSVVLFSGSSGASFTMPLLRDLIEYWKDTQRRATGVINSFIDSSGVVTRRVRFVWVVRSGDQMSWFAEQLNDAISDVQRLQDQGHDVELHASVYVTCDDTFTAFQDTDAHSDGAKMAAQLVTEKDSAYVSDQVRRENSVNDSKRTSGEVSNRPLKSPEKLSLHASTAVLDVKEIDPRSGGEPNANSADVKTCGPDGTCCCRMTITDEDADAIAQDAICSCNCTHNNTSSQSASSAPIEKASHDISCEQPSRSKAILHPQVALLSGRPHLRTVIRRSLEQAHGESAVVVCGPRGMNEDARRAVVGLSDERAIGRATGALGVWFWAEGFGW